MSEVARCTHGTAVRDRVGRGERDRAAAGECRLHARGIFRLNTDDLYLRIDELCAECNTGGKPAAADGDEDCVHILECVNHLESNRALSDEYIAVVERVDVDIALFFLQLEAVRVGIVKSVAMEDDRCAERTRRLDLEDRRCCGHADHSVYTELLRSIGDTLRVVAG